MPPKKTNRANDSGRTEAGTQETDRVEILKPLTIGDIGLPPWNVFHMLGVDQIYFEAARLQNLIDRDPIHAGGFHSDRMNAALLKPVGQRIQISCECGETAHGLRVATGANCDE
jgi:hypothetical protein